MDELAILLEKAKEALRRDLNHIFTESSQGKLSASSARDLVAYIKLLGDVLDNYADLSADLQKQSDTELNEALKATIPK